jgi:hypothetical protein
MSKTDKTAPLPIVGWREWLALPDLGVEAVKAKIDTGARSSALHAWNITTADESDGRSIVRFTIHPIQRKSSPSIDVEAELVDMRRVRNSGGQVELRPVIRTSLGLGGVIWPIELTLTDRDTMGFRMLLGRQAVRRRFLVNPARSYLQSKRPGAKSR